MADTTTGCSLCGSPDTETVDGVHGRRCAGCRPTFSPKHLAGLVADGMGVCAYARTAATLPPGGFRADLADHLVDLGRADAAFAYLAAWLTFETARRFRAVVLP